MTAEQVFHLYRTYKFYYNGSYDLKKYRGRMKHPPLIQQRDRQYFWRIAQKMGDAQINALFTAGFFFHPRAHISEFVTPDGEKAALLFAGRGENGVELLRSDLYELAKVLSTVDITGWLYGETAVIPECLQQVIAGDLPLDLACLLLLIPQPALGYNWPVYWKQFPDLGLGPSVWIDRLKKVDQLLNMQRQMWRMTTHELAKDFWTSLGITTLAPRIQHTAPSLF